MTYAYQDTSPEALDVQLDVIRNMSPQRRVDLAFQLTAEVRKMGFDAIRRRHPDLDEQAVQLQFIELVYGEALANEVSVWLSENQLVDNNLLFGSLAPVISSLNTLQIPHFVGGSVAGSFHGAFRSTMDVDLACKMNEHQVDSFIELLGDDYYFSRSAICRAIERKTSFKLIYLPNSFKVDVFISRGRPFDNDSMTRATTEILGSDQTLEVPICSAEDSIISKLERYRLGNDTSERQWDDVSRLIKLLGDQADIKYMTHAAESVGVSDLLEKLLCGA
jgi:hypothetical protein